MVLLNFVVASPGANHRDVLATSQNVAVLALIGVDTIGVNGQRHYLVDVAEAMGIGVQPLPEKPVVIAMSQR